jgi:hypothetical protein
VVTLLLLAALTCVACIVIGALVPDLRPMATSGGAALLFLTGLLLWWTLLRSGAVSGLPAGPLGALLFLLPPVLPAAGFLYFVSRRGGTA